MNLKYLLDNGICCIVHCDSEVTLGIIKDKLDKFTIHEYDCLTFYVTENSSDLFAFYSDFSAYSLYHNITVLPDLIMYKTIRTYFMHVHVDSNYDIISIDEVVLDANLSGTVRVLDNYESYLVESQNKKLRSLMGSVNNKIDNSITLAFDERMPELLNIIRNTFSSEYSIQSTSIDYIGLSNLCSKFKKILLIGCREGGTLCPIGEFCYNGDYLAFKDGDASYKNLVLINR